MIDVLRSPAAVLALVVVSHHHGATTERCPGSIGNLHEVIEPHHCGCGQFEVLAAVDVTVAMEDLGLLGQGEYQCPPDRNHTQRLVGDVQYEHSSQDVRKYSQPRRHRPLIDMRVECALL